MKQCSPRKRHTKSTTGILPGLGLALLLGQADSSAFASTESGLNAWAKQQIESTLTGCSKKTADSVFAKLKSLELEYSSKVDEVPLARLVEMPQDSEFIEMGQVLFPAMLPGKYPAKLLYMTCDEEHRNFMASKTRPQMKETLSELRDCFERSYRIGMPKLAGVLLACYQELTSR
ncbi:MAG: hypothetical protein EBX52_14650 [Proteobacteria bacterium]|nr:hypothetical protein [Pseudomonadota bacterium]